MTFNPYPLKFKPLFQERVWGGREIERFGYDLPPGKIGEGWMIADHPSGISHIANGELAGLGLDEVRKRFGHKWLGKKGQSRHGRFPLLIKLLDCNENLSVQVHPNDEYKNLPVGELGKTEMWYIVDAKPESKIIFGLKPEIDCTLLREAVEKGYVMDTLQVVNVQKGDCFYIPAGTVHALCAGVLVAEIQQNSDTTYRLYDYNRPGLDGKPRVLHVEDSLNVITYDFSEARHIPTLDMKVNKWIKLVESPYFLTEKGTIEGSMVVHTSEDSCDIIIVVEGAGSIAWANGEVSARAGDCFVIPANLGEYEMTGNLTVLRSRIL